MNRLPTALLPDPQVPDTPLPDMLVRAAPAVAGRRGSLWWAVGASVAVHVAVLVLHWQPPSHETRLVARPMPRLTVRLQQVGPAPAAVPAAPAARPPAQRAAGPQAAPGVAAAAARPVRAARRVPAAAPAGRATAAPAVVAQAPAASADAVAVAAALAVEPSAVDLVPAGPAAGAPGAAASAPGLASVARVDGSVFSLPRIAFGSGPARWMNPGIRDHGTAVPLQAALPPPPAAMVAQAVQSAARQQILALLDGQSRRWPPPADGGEGGCLLGSGDTLQCDTAGLRQALGDQATALASMLHGYRGLQPQVQSLAIAFQGGRYRVWLQVGHDKEPNATLTPGLSR